MQKSEWSYFIIKTGFLDIYSELNYTIFSIHSRLKNKWVNANGFLIFFVQIKSSANGKTLKIPKKAVKIKNTRKTTGRPLWKSNSITWLTTDPSFNYQYEELKQKLGNGAKVGHKVREICCLSPLQAASGTVWSMKIKKFYYVLLELITENDIISIQKDHNRFIVKYEMNFYYSSWI